MPERSDDIIRVIRLLEYTGKRSVVENTLARNAVKRVHVTQDMIIKEVYVEPFPDIKTEKEDEADA